MRSRKTVGVLGVTALLCTLIAMPAQAGAQTRADGVDGTTSINDLTRTTQANFEGSTIDLAGDWGDAQACLVWRQAGISECFRTTEALDAREKELAPQREVSRRSGAVAAYSSSCSSSLRLYEHNWYGGRRLSFWDRGYWQNLAWYGFEDRTSSYIVGGCPVYLAEHGDGGGWWYPGPTYPYAGEPAMYWDWQDTLSSIYIG